MLILNRRKARLSIDCLLFVIVAITAWRVGMPWLTAWQDRPAFDGMLTEPLRPGTKISILDGHGIESKQNVVLVVNTTCPGSNDSVQFYRRLATRIDSMPHARIVVLSDETEGAVRQWLEDNSIGVRHVVQVPALVSVGLDWTPTLFIVGENGVVTDLMIGALSELEEESFMARLAHVPGTEPMNNLPVLKTVSDGEFREKSSDARPQVIDVRKRDAYNRNHRAGAVNIPSDELETRASIELATELPAYVDCSVGIPYPECRHAAYVLAFGGFPRVGMIVQRGGDAVRAAQAGASNRGSVLGSGEYSCAPENRADVPRGRISERYIRLLALESPKPRYPAASIDSGAVGVAVATILIDEDGRTEGVCVLQAPDAHVREAVSHALNQWTFRNVAVDDHGAGVPMSSKLSFYFMARNGGAVLSPEEMRADLGLQEPSAGGAENGNGVAGSVVGR